MSRYIDADAFLKEYCEPYPHVFMAISRAMADAPSIDIVRCKECKYWLSDKPIKNKWFQNGEVDQCKWRTDESPNPDDFCSYGEREGE